jgi:hypothetical protein
MTTGASQSDLLDESEFRYSYYYSLQYTVQDSQSCWADPSRLRLFAPGAQPRADDSEVAIHVH